MNPYDYPLSLKLDFSTGALEPGVHVTPRRVSDLALMFHDKEAVAAAIAQRDPVVYEILSQGFPGSRTDAAIAISRIYPGRVGDEYHFTKGHFHERDDQAEVYFCLKGEGYLLLERADGEFRAEPWQPGTISHIPPAWGHRVVNTGRDLLFFIGIYHLSAGHSYKQVEERGFAQLVVERDGRPILIPNPRRIPR
ncbi:MAG: glucose-6-phosphate isomerase [Anaerolineae bacterium]|nr:glucose-6-phosphate isomerase [Anaerolineae bacterium]